MSKLYKRISKRSKWNGDYSKNDLPKKFFVNPLCTIKGKWQRPKIYKKIEGFRSPIAKKQMDILGKDHKDLYSAGDLDPKKNKDLIKVAHSIGLNDVKVRLHIQQPGQMHMLHWDNGSKYKKDKTDTAKTRRVMIMLDEWHPGQILMFGGKHIYKWKKGDVIYFDWFNIPHGTANFGHHSRSLLLVTGQTTSSFENLIKHPGKIIKI